MSAIHWRMAASMKVPPKRKGNTAPPQTKKPRPRLNESPSEKEGKYRKVLHARPFYSASMKVPPKRKGNPNFSGFRFEEEQASMKVPPKRKGNRKIEHGYSPSSRGLNESPSEKEGKFCDPAVQGWGYCLNESPSEKEGKYTVCYRRDRQAVGLNESPSEKEGKYSKVAGNRVNVHASMKVPPKRKGNSRYN